MIRIITGVASTCGNIGVLEPIGEMLRQYAQRERSFCFQRYLAYSVILHLWRSACLERPGEWHHRAVRQLDPRPT